MKKIKTIFKWIRRKAAYITISSFILSLLSLFIFSKNDIQWIGNIGWSLLILTVIMVLIGIVFAWIINPIRDKKNKIKK